MINVISIKDCEDAGREHDWRPLTSTPAKSRRPYHMWCKSCGAIGVKVPDSDIATVVVTRRIRMLQR